MTAEKEAAARALANSLREQYPSHSATELARLFGVELRESEWISADGRVIFLAECLLKPPKIVLNRAAIRVIAQQATARTTTLTQGIAAHWFTTTYIEEVIIAHELYHLLSQEPSSPAVELMAHAFAGQLLELPFSPKLYEILLARASHIATGIDR